MLTKNKKNPFLIQRQMMQAIKCLPKEYKRCLAQAQLKLVQDSQTMTILEFKKKYFEGV